jgi:predicted short-subunit dehydrogenase-like oxidoreductase (DUF2520 family)
MPPITLIGAGNVGTHLAKRLSETGYRVTQVFSRDKAKAEVLAEIVGAAAIDQLSEVSAHTGLYLLAVRDDVIAETGRRLSEAGISEGLFAHTSGATPASVLAPYSVRFGIFYPLQTFSPQRTPDFLEIPVCIQASSPEDEVLLKNIAERIGKQAVAIEEQQRIALHVAAVFVNNFSNYLYQTGQRILEKEQLNFDLLIPLIRETAEKVRHLPPKAAQTGPAVRGDEQTIARHLAYLQEMPDEAKLYEMITKRLIER